MNRDELNTNDHTIRMLEEFNILQSQSQQSKAWWDQCESIDFPEEEFKKCFRMSKSTFDMICRLLEPTVNKKDTPVPVRLCVAVCLWRLATGDPLREVSKRFCLSISTCHKLVLEICKAIHDVLKPMFLNWPDEQKSNEIKQNFKSLSGIPHVIGSLYTTHILIISPKDKIVASPSRNQQTSSCTISVQGVVAYSGIFIDVFIGWPGLMPDQKVLEKSSLFTDLMKDFTLVGNTGHVLTDWVLVPYSQKDLTWSQHEFNEKVAEVQGIGKEAFMRLKARWRCLQKKTEMKLEDLHVVLMACCVLHNICEMNHEGLGDECKFVLFDDDEMVTENNDDISEDVLRYRDQIAHKVLLTDLFM